MEYKDFNEYLNYFNGLDQNERKVIILEQIKLLDNLSNIMCKELNVTKTNTFNIKEEVLTEDEYLESLISYINSIQNNLCDFSDKFTQVLEYASTKEG